MYQNPHGLVGQTIDTYKIEEILGHGGMGVVYRAENTTLESKVALKIVGPQWVENDSFIKRFEQEAKVLARLRHPNIVQVYDLRHTDNLLYFVMELVEGETLENRLVREGHIPWKKSLDIVKQLLAAFQFAHDANIIHRDIKPGNIMINSQGRVKVLDFGLAKLLREGSMGNATLTDNKVTSQSMTQIGAGTPKYTSPEQARGTLTIDHRADIFSLGMTLYETLSGALPFENTDSIFTIQQKIVEEIFPPIHEINNDVPVELSNIVSKAIEKYPELRYSSSKEMLADVESFERKVIKEELKPLPVEPKRVDDDDTLVPGMLPENLHPPQPSIRKSSIFSNRGVQAGIAGLLLIGIIALLTPLASDLFGGQSGSSGETPVAVAPVIDNPSAYEGPVKKVNMVSNPSGAEIYVDGVKKGWTPDPDIELPLGQSTLVVFSLNGYQSDSTYLEVTESTNTVSKVLTPLTGDLLIAVKPGQATLYIDNVPYADGGASSTFNVELPGTVHNIRPGNGEPYLGKRCACVAGRHYRTGH